MSTTAITGTTITLVDTVSLLHECLADVSPPELPPSHSIAIDLEGVNLCRHGKLSIMQLMAANSSTVWLVDVTTLGSKAFEEADERGVSLRTVLEGTDIQKVTPHSLVIEQGLDQKRTA